MTIKKLITTRTPIVAMMLGMSPIAANAADPYVESQGHAGISTGYCMTTNSRVEVDFAMTMLDSTTVGSRLFGVEDADGKGGMVLSVYMPGSNQKFAFRIGNGTGNKKEYWSNVTPAVGNRHTAVFDIYHDKMHFITGATTNWSQTASDTIGTISKDCTQPLALFAYMDGATRPIASAAYAKIYRCKIYEKDVLVHNFEPSKKDDGTIGFKDLITGSFIANTVYSNNASYPATENFIAGSDCAIYTSPYVESKGHAGISTGYRMKTNSRIEVDFAMTAVDSTTANTRLFGEEASGSSDGGILCYVYMPGSNQKFAFYVGNGTAKKNYWASETPVVGNRHTAVFDIYHDKMHFITGTTTNWSQTASDTIGPFTVDATQAIALFATPDGAQRPISSCSKLKIYGCKIYEEDVLVHNFEPCKKDDGTIGFKDTVDDGFISNTVYSNNSSYPAIENFIAVGFVPTISQSAMRISQRQMVTLTASAPGAVSYRWLKNGEVISGGANGTLTVSWRKPNNAPTDTYRAIACYTLTDGQTAESAASSGLSIENMPAGLIIAIQ